VTLYLPISMICMEYLNRCHLQLRKNAAFHFHPRCKRLNLIHVCFVDDLLLFSRGDVDSVSQLFEAFNLFSAAPGLKANQDTIVTKFNLIKGELPFRYLGVPLSSKKIIFYSMSTFGEEDYL